MTGFVIPPTVLGPPLDWMDELDEGILCLTADRRVLCANAAARRLLSLTPQTGDELPELFSVLSLQTPSVLEPLLQSVEGQVTVTVLTRRGPIRARISCRAARPPLPGSLMLLFKTGAMEVQSGSAAGIIAFYSLLMHELKNPLAAVKMLIQGMQLELSTSPTSSGATSVLDTYLSRANREVDRVTRRMDAVKFLSKLNLERQERYDLAVLARGVISHLAGALAKAQVRCQQLLEDGQAWLVGDPDEMRQVLLNLMDFALESMGERGGLIRLVVKVDRDAILLQLTDTGVGYTETELNALYARNDPFRSGSLGLSVARWIIERYQGQLQFVSQKGRGTTVDVRLPLSPSETPEDGMGRP